MVDPETVEVYFTNLDRGEIGEVFPVPREVADDDLPLAALDELLAGPTAAERAEGYSSWFSDDTAGLVDDLSIERSVAHVDFDASLPETIPNASTSAGSTSLLAELDTTLEQFPEITSSRYSLDGDVTAFYEWLQLAAPNDDGAASVEQVTVEIYFGHQERGTDTSVFPVERSVDPPAVLDGSLRELLAGPTAAELDVGYTSWFSDDTAGLLHAVTLDEGVAQVDFDASLPEVIPNASTSAGSTALLAALDATTTQFPTVDEAVYSLDGDVDAFYEWLQLAAPN